MPQENEKKASNQAKNDTDCYLYYPRNIIIRHRDQLIMGKNIFGVLTYSFDFQFTYYHLSRGHVVRENPNF